MTSAQKLMELATLSLEWMQRGACHSPDVDDSWFFPTRGDSLRPAKMVCRDCQVREDCLEYALAIGEKFGVWGGMSERERRRLRRQRALAEKAGRPAPVMPPVAVAPVPKPPNTKTGSANPRSRLTEADIPVIDAKRDSGLTYATIAQDYHVHWTSIRDAYVRITWAHVPKASQTRVA